MSDKIPKERGVRPSEFDGTKWDTFAAQCALYFFQNDQRYKSDDEKTVEGSVQGALRHAFLLAWADGDEAPISRA